MAAKKTPKRTTKATIAKKAAPRAKKKIEDMQVTDGKITLANDVKEIKDLENLLNVQQFNPFKTTNTAVLKSRMDEMTLTDLQTMAIEVGILPSGNKLGLKNKILKAFKSHAGAGTGYNIGFQRPLVDPSSDAAAKILKISQEPF
jgi:hypothetical protein